jgi:carbamoyltransferase
MDVLGITHGIDAAAALVRQGEIAAAVTDERFTRKKHSRDFPSASIDYCLRHGGLALPELDAVAFFWNPGVHLESFNPRQASVVRHHSEYLASLPSHLLALHPAPWSRRRVTHVEQRLALEGEARPLTLHYVSHHVAHAASCFFPSEFEEAAILTVDGYGERTSAFLGRGRGQHVEALREIEFPHSLGAFYAAMTEYLGFLPNCDEGKLMGLAAHGEPRFAKAMAEIVRVTPDGGLEVDLSYFGYHQERPRRYSRKLVERFGPDRRADEPVEDRHRDVAASAQRVLEEALVTLARWLRRETGLPRLALAGGVALNCVANSRVIQEGGFDDAFIQPAAGDNGAALGAALFVTHQLHGVPRRPGPYSDFLGPAFSEEETERTLSEARLAYERCPDVAEACAERLASGEIIGWFQGRMEFGPRALGARSILADPRDAEVKRRLDATIKRREPWRPYAPAVLKEAHSRFFSGPGTSPFMLRSYEVRPSVRSVIPAIVHVDGSARVQTVDEGRSPLFFRLIRSFERRTGVPVLLNTSFNGRGETMVATVPDALRCFFTTGLDALAVGPFLLTKPGRRRE